MKNISSVLFALLLSALTISAQSRVPAEEVGSGNSSALIAMTVIGLLIAGLGVIGFIGVLVWYFLKKK